MMFVICCCNTLTGQLDSVCTSRNSNSLIVVVSFAVVDASAFVSVVLEVRHCWRQESIDFVYKLSIVKEYRCDLICTNNALFIYPRFAVFVCVLEQHVGGEWWCDLSHGPFSLKPPPTLNEF